VSLDPFFHLKNSDEGRAEFRRRYHYFVQLKNWQDYYVALDSLDAKSTGLLTISGIMTAVFAIFISGGVGQTVGLVPDGVHKFLATFGLMIIAVSLLLFLRCFGILSNKLSGLTKHLFLDLESVFNGTTTRQKQAQIDYAIERYAETLINPLEETPRVQALIAPLLNAGTGYDAFEATLMSSFNTFRAHVEAEIIARHRYYQLGAAGVFTSFVTIFLLAASVFGQVVTPGNDVIILKCIDLGTPCFL